MFLQAGMTLKKYKSISQVISNPLKAQNPGLFFCLQIFRGEMGVNYFKILKKRLL